MCQAPRLPHSLSAASPRPLSLLNLFQTQLLFSVGVASTLAGCRGCGGGDGGPCRFSASLLRLSANGFSHPHSPPLPRALPSSGLHDSRRSDLVVPALLHPFWLPLRDVEALHGCSAGSALLRFHIHPLSFAHALGHRVLPSVLPTEIPGAFHLLWTTVRILFFFFFLDFIYFRERTSTYVCTREQGKGRREGEGENLMQTRRPERAASVGLRPRTLS